MNSSHITKMTSDFEIVRNTILAYPEFTNVSQTKIIDSTENHITVELVNNRGWVSTIGITLNSDRSVTTSIGIMFSQVEHFEKLFWTIDWFHWSTSKKDVVFC